MANEAETAIYNRLAAAPTCHPASTSLFVDDWGLEPGDVVTVQSGEDSYTMPIYSMDLKWTGASTVEAQSTGNKKREPLPALTRKQYGASAGSHRWQEGVEAQIKEFETEFEQTDYEISLRAYQRDMDTAESILRQAGLSLNAQGVLVYADDNANMWQSRLNVQADRIGLVVQGTGANASIKAAEIVASINDEGSNVAINANHIYLNGTTKASDIFTMQGNALNMSVGRLTSGEISTESLEVEFGTINMGGTSATWKSTQVVTGITVTGGIVTDVQTATLHYIGRNPT